MLNVSVDFYKYFRQTRMPPVEAALVVTYLQFPIEVCFPCSVSPSPTRLRHHHRHIPELILGLHCSSDL